MSAKIRIGPESLEDACEKTNKCVDEYNNFRPHSSLNNITPAEMIEQCQNKEDENSKNYSLPAASVSEAMYFAAEENNSALSENTWLQKQILTLQRSPISPT